MSQIKKDVVNFEDIITDLMPGEIKKLSQCIDGNSSIKNITSRFSSLNKVNRDSILSLMKRSADKNAPFLKIYNDILKID